MQYHAKKSKLALYLALALFSGLSQATFLRDLDDDSIEEYIHTLENKIGDSRATLAVFSRTLKKNKEKIEDACSEEERERNEKYKKTLETAIQYSHELIDTYHRELKTFVDEQNERKMRKMFNEDRPDNISEDREVEQSCPIEDITGSIGLRHRAGIRSLPLDSYF